MGRQRSSASSVIEEKSANSSDSGGRGVSKLDLARNLLSGSSERRPSSRARSRSGRGPQDRDTFDDGKSASGASSIYTSRSGGGSGSKGFGGKYDGDLNDRGLRHGYGTFVADNGNEYEGEWKNDKVSFKRTFSCFVTITRLKLTYLVIEARRPWQSQIQHGRHIHRLVEEL